MSQVFIERGRELADARDLLALEPVEYASALALTAIHSAIAFNDAVQIRLSGAHWTGDDHQHAATVTLRLCQRRGLATRGLQQLRTLLAKKTPYSYGEDAVTEDQALSMHIASQRFQTWAELILEKKP